MGKLEPDHPYKSNVSVCPLCGKKPADKHCISPTCTWLLCLDCTIFYTADGSRTIRSGRSRM